MRRIISHFLAIACYWLGVDLLFYFLNRKAKRILTFHNVLPDALFWDGVANGVSHKLSDFMKIIRVCRDHYRMTTDIFDSQTLTVTFDDGYRCQYSTAFMALRRMGIPAYVFVAENICEGEGLLVDRLLHWVDHAPLSLIPDQDRRRYWAEDVWPAFLDDRTGKGMNVFKRLDAKWAYSKILAELPVAYVKERLGAIASSELDEMRACGWQIGWHTRNHFPLSCLDEDAVREELDSPKVFRHVCLSFPYGRMKDVGTVAVELAAKMGYPCAVANTNSEKQKYSSYFLPRMTILSANKYEVEFVLSGAKYFLQNHSLLPVILKKGKR